MVTVRGWLAVLLSVFAVGTASALGSGFDPGPGAAAGGGVTVGEAVSGGTASRLLFSDASTQVSNATPVAVTSSLDLTSGTLDVGGACTLDSTLDVRGAISNGGSGTCNGLNAGSACINDAAGAVITTGGTAAVVPLSVEAPAVSGATEAGLVQLFATNSSSWMSFRNNANSGTDVSPALVTRGTGTAVTTQGLVLFGGVESGADSTSATQPVNIIDAVRQAGTPAVPSISAITGKPLFGVHTAGTKVFAINVNGGLGLRHITPAAMSADVDNYALCTTTPICRIDSGASARNVTGIVPGFNSAYESSQSELFFVCAVGANNLVLKHDVTSTAANRFTFNGSTDRTVLAGSCFPLIYDRTSQRWRAANGT